MIPVDQTIFGDKKGNCFQACVASIFERSLDSVPHFCLEEGEEWLSAVNDWLQQEYGLGILFIHTKDCDDPEYILKKYCKGYQLAGVTSVRNIKHAVVIEDGKIVHDPHPSRNSMDRQIEDIQIFTVSDLRSFLK